MVKNEFLLFIRSRNRGVELLESISGEESEFQAKHFGLIQFTTYKKHNQVFVSKKN